MVRTCRSTRSRRRGVLSMELLLTLPILTVFLFGLLEFSLLFFARADVVEASRAGARAARLYGATAESVEEEVRFSLGGRFAPHVRVQAQLGDKTGDDVLVAVEVPMAAASPDLLWLIGYSLQGRDLYCETRMTRE
jgi:Flp pilus assembly protein TadG